MSNTAPKTVKIHKLPLIIKKNAIQTCDKSKQNYELLFHYVKNAKPTLYKEDIIYKSQEKDFLKGKYPNLIITNRLNLLKYSSRTVATYTENSTSIELNSDAVTSVIGQGKYDTVLGALCSVINQELKIQGILSLLTSGKKTEPSNTISQESQTDQTSRELLLRDKQRRRSKRKTVRPYIVKDDMLPDKSLKRVIVDPKNIDLLDSNQIKIEWEEKQISSNIEETKDDKEDEQSTGSNLPDIKMLLNEDSNMSDTSIGNLSIGSCNIPNILENPLSLLIDKHTKDNDIENNTSLVMMDGSLVTIRGKPDVFHLATPDILRDLSPTDQKRILIHQAYIDWKYCLQRDEDDNLPIHHAVVEKDVELLKRQCMVLKSRHQTVDILSGGNLTALQMAILHDSPQCTAVLLQHGADPLVQDEESRSPLHLAAEASEEHVAAILNHCRNNAREILKDNEELWKPHFETKSDEQLAEYLLYKICVVYDNQGYTPLMTASRLGAHASVRLLAGAARGAVDLAVHSSGDTALYLAVAAACLDCAERLDKTTVATKYLKTIEILVENGADPSVENNSGSNVNVLLSEFCISQLSTLIANKLTAAKYFDGKQLKLFDSYMLVKYLNGTVNLEKINKSKSKDENTDDSTTDIQTKDLKSKHLEKKNVVVKAKKVIVKNVNPKVLKTTKKLVTTKKNSDPSKNVPVIIKNEKLENENDKNEQSKEPIFVRKIEQISNNNAKTIESDKRIQQNIPVVTKFETLEQFRNRPLILKKTENSKTKIKEVDRIVVKNVLLKQKSANSVIVLPKTEIDQKKSTKSYTNKRPSEPDLGPSSSKRTKQ